MAVFDFIRNRVLGNVIGFGAGAAAATAFEPPIRNIAAEIEAQFTSRRLSAAELAELVIRGVRTADNASDEAAETGYNADRFRQLTLLAGNPPGPEVLLELWRRGVIDETDVDRGIRQGRTRTEWLPAIKALREQHLTAPEAAALVAQGALTPDEGAEEARLAGVNQERFDALIQAASNPPAVGQVLQSLNRGDMGEAEARLAIRRSGIRPEYIDAVMALRFAIPNAPDVVRFALREVYNPAIARKYGQFEAFPDAAMADATRAGIDQETMLKYWAAHWDLPSRAQGYEMYHRRIITEQELTDLLRASDVMPGWIQNLIKVAFNPLTRVDVRRMYRDGVLTKEQVVSAYLDIGYSPENARRLGEWVSVQKTQTERDFTKAEILALYQARSMPKEDASENLTAMGYSTDEIVLLLALADYRRNKTRRDAAVSAIRGRYKARELTQLEVSERLDGMGIPPDERDELIDLWTFELEETPQRLSEAQARRAWLKGIITEEQYYGRLLQIGYPEEDAKIQVASYRAA